MSRSFRFFLPLLMGAAALLMVGTARAQSTETLLLAGACMPPDASAADVASILEAELFPLRVELLTAENAGRRSAVVGIDECNGSPPAARISMWRDGQRRERWVVLAGTAPGTESRTLALAIAEALRDPAATHPVPPGPLAPTPTPEVSSPPPVDANPRAAPSVRSGLAPHAGLSFRYLPATSTPALGVEGGVDWDRFGVGLLVLGARKGSALGTASLVAVAASVSVDAIEFGTTTAVRLQGEFGVAVGTGQPNPSAIGSTQAAFHTGLLAGMAQKVPLGGRYGLEGFIGGGYVSSLSANAEGQRVAGLGGATVAFALALEL